MPSPDAPQPDERFLRMLMRHEASLRSYILALLPRWADADEVLQNTSIVIWRKFSDLSHDEAADDRRFMQWACSIARFEVLNFRRREQRSPLVFSDELLQTIADESIAEDDRRRAEREALADCLAKLPEPAADLVQQCYAGAMTIREVAEQSDRSVAAVYKQLHRIRKQLLQCIRRALRQGGLL